jgi:hypothetical protein
LNERMYEESHLFCLDRLEHKMPELKREVELPIDDFPHSFFAKVISHISHDQTKLSDVHKAYLIRNEEVLLKKLNEAILSHSEILSL